MSDSIKMRAARHEVKPGHVEPERLHSETTFRKPSNIRRDVKYFNYSSTDLTILTREGIEIPLDTEPPETNDVGISQMGALLVVVEYSISTPLLSRLNVPFADDAGEIIGAEALLVKNWLHDELNDRRRLNTGFNTPAILRLVYRIRPDVIHEALGSVYFETVDIVVSERNVAHVLHPFSAMGKQNQSLWGMKQITPAAVLGMRIVDNGGRIGPLFTRFGNRIVCIRPDIDLDDPDGVYVDVVGAVTSEEFKNRAYLPECIDWYAPGDERIRTVLGLYSSYHQALTGMDVKELAAKHIKDTEEAERNAKRNEEELERHARKMEELDRRAIADAKRIEADTFERETALFKFQCVKDAQVVKDNERVADAEVAAQKAQRDAAADARKAAAELENQNQRKKYEQDLHEMQTQREWLKFVTPVASVIAGILASVVAFMNMRAAQSQKLASGLFSVGRLFV